MNPESINVARSQTQFSIAAILEYTALCCGLAAFERSSGVVSCAFLMAMALSLGAKQGGLAIAMLIAASIASQLRLPSLQNGTADSRQLIVVLLAVVLCVWYRLRNRCPAATR